MRDRLGFGCKWLLAIAVVICGRISQAQSPSDLLAAGRADDALHKFQSDVQKSPGDATAQNLLCRAYFMTDDWDHAISACERARDLDRKNSDYELWLGRAYGEKADRVKFLSAASLVGKVRESFERAVALDPNSWRARSDLAEFYMEAPALVGGGKDKALKQADALARLNAGMSHWVLGRLAEKDKDPVQAEREFRAEIASTHSAVKGWVELAIFYRHTDRLDDMEDALHRAEWATVDCAESLMDGASLLLRTSRSPELAIRLLRRYLTAPVEEGPAFRAHDMLGELLEKQGNRSAAAAEYRASLSLYRGYARAREDLQRVEH